MILWFDVLFWLYSAQIVLFFCKREPYAQTSDVTWCSPHSFQKLLAGGCKDSTFIHTKPSIVETEIFC